VWAVGATLFNLLTGRDVHQAPTHNEALLLAMTTPVPPVQTLAPGIPDGLARVLDRALAFDKAARWADAGAMQRALRGIHDAPAVAPPPVDAIPLATIPTLETPIAATSPTPGPAKSRRTIAWWVGLALVVGLAIAGLAVRRGPASSAAARPAPAPLVAEAPADPPSAPPAALPATLAPSVPAIPTALPAPAAKPTGPRSHTARAPAAPSASAPIPAPAVAAPPARSQDPLGPRL